MHDLTTQELATLVGVFDRAEVSVDGSAEGRLFAQVKSLHEERIELDSLDFDDCAGGACKL